METLDNRSTAFDGLRGFAAIYVVMFHLAYSHPDFASLSTIAKSIVIAGSRTVPIFFVLSGIFVTSSLRKILETKMRPLRDFVVRRFFRIMPLWWILLIWMFGLEQISSKVLFANAIFYFGDLKLDSKWLPVVPAWSLAVEVCFYIFIAIFARVVVSAKRNATFVAWFIGCLATAVWRALGRGAFGLDSFQVSSFALDHLSYFVAGIAIEKWHHDGGRLESWFEPNHVKLLEAVAVALFLLSAVPNFYILPLEILAPLIVLLSGCSTGVLGKFFGSFPLRSIGLASYGIYILQNFAAYCAGRWIGGSSLAFVVFWYTLTTIAFGIISYWTIERPFIKLGRKLQSSKLVFDLPPRS